MPKTKSLKPRTKCPYCDGEYISLQIHQTAIHRHIMSHNTNKKYHPNSLHDTNPEPIKWSENELFCGCVACRADRYIRCQCEVCQRGIEPVAIRDE